MSVHGIALVFFFSNLILQNNATCAIWCVDTFQLCQCRRKDCGHLQTCLFYSTFMHFCCSV